MKKPYTLTGYAATQADAYKLMHEGALALAEVEHTGLRVDVDYINTQWDRLQDELDELEAEFRGTPLWGEIERAHRTTKGKLGMKADACLRQALYEQMGIVSDGETDSGAKSVAAEDLTLLLGEVPELATLLRWRKLDKARNTYFAQFRREHRGGWLHPMFNLHKVVTYRSSSNNPNFQNMPIRDKEIGKLVRQAILPREGRQIVEIDFSGAEIRVAACYHKDPNMIREINDPALDMHRDMAAECYLLPRGEVTHDIRHQGKNGFVFPEFYGSYHTQCAREMWQAVDLFDLELKNGTRLRQHLEDKGIHDLQDFTRVVQKAESIFWDKRFPVYNAWREDLWAFYEKNGYVDMLTGFRCSDVAKRNEVINRPIQGAAFHCLLWSLTRLQQELKVAGLKSVIIGQIHDSIILDVVPGELDEVLALARKVMTKDLLKEWDWIIVPMDVEADVAPVDGSWHEKKKHKLAA